MAGTYGDLQTRIAADLLRDDLSVQIANAIQDAILLWEGERFSFNERIYRVTTSQGVEYYDLKDPTLKNESGGAVGAGEIPLEIDSITCKPVGSGLPYPIMPETQQWFDEMQASPTVAQGLPDKYAIYNRRLRIFPVPNGGHLLTISAGLARLPTLALTTDTNDWMTEGVGVIREQAKLLICRDILRDEAGTANAAMALQGYVANLQRKGNAYAMTGRQRAWDL